MPSNVLSPARPLPWILDLYICMYIDRGIDRCAYTSTWLSNRLWCAGKYSTPGFWVAVGVHQREEKPWLKATSMMPTSLNNSWKLNNWPVGTTGSITSLPRQLEHPQTVFLLFLLRSAVLFLSMPNSFFQSLRPETLESLSPSLILPHPPSDSTAHLVGSTFKIYLRSNHFLLPAVSILVKSPPCLNQSYCNGLLTSFLFIFQFFSTQ